MIFGIENLDLTREIALILNGMLIAVTFITGIDLIKKYLNADENTRKTETFLIFMIMALVVTAYSFYNIPSIVSYYYNDFGYVQINPLYMNTFNVLFQLLMIMPVAVVCERIILPKKYLIKIKEKVIPISAILGVIVLSLIIFVIVSNPTYNWVEQPWFPSVMMGILVPTYVVFSLFGFIGMVYIIIVRLGPQKEDRKNIVLALLGLIIAFAGGMVTVMYRKPQGTPLMFPALQTFEGTMLVASIAVEVSGWMMFRFFFLRIKDYTELEWRSGLEDMYIIMAETGIGLYACEFNKSAQKVGSVDNINLSGEEISEKVNSDLIAGGLVGIKSMLSEIAGTKRGVLEVLSLKNKSLICKQGKYILAVLKAKSNLGVYHTMLRQLIDEIEETNAEQLAKFRGDLRTLTIDPLVKAKFGKIVD